MREGGNFGVRRGPDLALRKVRDPWERFDENIIKDPNSGCWLWAGSLNQYGYGNFTFRTKRGLAHRVSYERSIGPIPEGLQIDHKCRTRGCVRPDHLEPVTPGENVRRGLSPALTSKRTKGKHKTHCPKGHPYSGDNLYTHPTNGWSGCRACCKEKMQRRRAAGLNRGRKI